MVQHIPANNDETSHQPDDAIAMLEADHRQIRALFQQYADTPDPYLKQIIAEHVFAELVLHTLFFSLATKVLNRCVCLPKIISCRLLDAEVLLLVILKMNLTEIIVAIIAMPIR